ncbi:MAG TPA: nitroreductase family deazaflavin-dependent oxidoreductase [Candidatus Acidoferrales bacterium]|nr:nitroreductase family deazaflavin-dependent oxidoreductase [Candidatus Acidoferrales bacterium]
MALREGAVFVGKLTTVGRKTGQPRTVELRLVFLGGKFYASSARVKGKHWCQNMLKNPAVEVSADGQRYRCAARQVTDDGLRRKILSLRDSPPLMERVVFELSPQR